MNCSEYIDLMKGVEEGWTSPELKSACQTHRLACPERHPFVLEDLILACEVTRDSLVKDGAEAAAGVFKRNVIPVLESLKGKSKSTE